MDRIGHFIMLIAVLIISNGCAMDIFSDDNIDEYPTYPSGEIRQSKCVKGEIDTIVSGPDATVIWYNSDGMMLQLRLPLNHDVKIAVANGIFCYDYMHIRS